MTSRQIRSRVVAVVIGVGCTLAVVATYLAGQLDWLEWRTLDMRFRHVNPIVSDGRITCVDIDDSAIELAGEWPWPRDWQGGIIDVLDELGARSILLDINYVDPQPPRVELPQAADVAARPAAPAGDALLEPDRELRASLLEAGNVHMAFWFEALGEASGVAERADGDEPAGGTHGLETRATDGNQGLETRATDGEPGLETRATSAATEADIRAWLAKHQPDRLRIREWWPQLYHAFTDRPIENASPAKALLRARLIQVLGEDATLRHALAEPRRVAGIARPVAGIVPTHYLIADAVAGGGFAVAVPEKADGVVRRQVLFVRHDNWVMPQLALAFAMSALGVGPADLSATGGALRLSRSDGTAVEVQVDETGCMVIPWLPQRDYLKQFVHVPAGPLWQVFDRRRMIADNERVIRDTVERALYSMLPEAEQARYAALLTAYKQAAEAVRTARYEGSLEQIRAARAAVAQRREVVDEFESAALDRLRSRAHALATQPYEPHEAEIDALDIGWAQLDGVEPVREANRRLQAEVRRVLDELRPHIQDRLCLLGYTATAVADVTPTPLHERVPGVMAHASILNGLLTGRTVRWVSDALNATFSLLLGLVVTLVAALWPPKRAIPLAALLGVGWAALAAYAFYDKLLWLAVTPAIGAMGLSLAGVAAYQYIFVDRERRQLAGALSQYTSKEIARQVAENPELCRRAEMREVTAMFTDLAGFTSISERIGAERTQRVLNVCLGEFTEVMLRHEAMVNKFIGDGIFAFWNPVIYPQPDNALLACETAVDLMDALGRLAARGGDENGEPVFKQLVLRIGVATGNAVVGPCGSEQKYDYTCIGDSVNVAARLESANKFYGTRILVSGPTRDAVGDRFAFRALGGVQVKGKTQAVPVYELLGRTGQLSEKALAYGRRFDEAVAQFQSRGFARAVEAFRLLASERPDDRAAQVYADASERFAAEPPPTQWNGAIELTEK